MKSSAYVLAYIGLFLLLGTRQPAQAEEQAQPQVDALPARETLQLPYKYVGNNFSHKFHRPSCPFARKMWPQRMQLFHFRKQAIDSDYRPCRYCLPPVWTS